MFNYFSQLQDQPFRSQFGTHKTTSILRDMSTPVRHSSVKFYDNVHMIEDIVSVVLQAFILQAKQHVYITLIVS